MQFLCLGDEYWGGGGRMVAINDYVMVTYWCSRFWFSFVNLVGTFSSRNTLALAIALTVVLDKISNPLLFNPGYYCYAQKIWCQKMDNCGRS